jgi:glutamate-ammonia-ligase adenylyltransferase
MTAELPRWEERFAVPAPTAAALREGLAALDDPPEAVQALAHLLERMADAGVAADVLAEPHAAAALVRMAYAAPFLLRVLAGRPELLHEGALAGLDAGGDALQPWRRYAEPAQAAALDESQLMAALRRWKYANYLRLTARELLGLQPARTTCTRIAELADGAVRIAHGYAFAQQAQRQGLPFRKRGGPAWAGVLGMGKLGGRELNYASDIDLIFVQDGDDGPCRGPEGLAAPPLDSDDGAEAAAWRHWAALAAQAASAPAGGTTSFDFHNRAARQAIRLLSTQQADGFAFRVDCDLRPNGKAGFLAPNVAFMEQYYLEHGREWERTAMLKARMVAGPDALAQRFAEMIRPFVYRRYLDYGALEGVALVKHDIDRVHRSALDRNLKLGRGGIRENEFLVQALQLLYGGKRPEVQVTGHEPAVERLVAAGILTAAEGEAIRADYWRLRAVENRIQMVAEAQTHDLPDDPAERTRILHDFAPDFATRQSAAEAALEAARRRTEERFQALFAGLGEQGFPDTDAWRRSVEAHVPEAERAAVLERLDGLFEHMMETRLGERCVFKLAKLLGREEVYTLGTDAAFPRWLAFIEQIGNRNPIYTLIETHPPIVPWVSRIFAEGGRHAEILIRHPEFLESFFSLGEDWRSFTGRFDEAMRAARDEEELLLEVQGAKAQGFIRTLTVYLGDEGYGAHQPLLSDVADATVRACTGFAWRILCERLGVPEGADVSTVSGFAVLAMGKLGSREMRFGSDLDLVFVYRDEGTTRAGRSHNEFYTKLAQKIGTLLTSQTQFGRLYVLDHRLRPFGNKGVLVPSISAYRNYLTPGGDASGAEVWNYQAFTRMRTVCGDAALGRDLIAAIAETWQQRALPTGEVARQVWDMLGRLVEQNARSQHAAGPALPLKFSVGGLIGYEFLGQAHFLCARRAPGADWTPPPPHGIMEALHAAYAEVSALDERLGFHERDERHELRPEHCERVAAIRERWRYEEVEALCARMATEIEAAFRAWGA